MGISITGGVKLPQGKFTVTSNRPPTWTTAAGTIGTEDEGTIVSFQFEASDPEQGTSGLTFSKISGDFPAGLSMDSAGLLTGTASDVESNTTSNFSLRVTDNGGLFEDRAFSMTIDDVFVVNSVDFDGTNDYLDKTTALTGVADSKTGIFSVWLRRGTSADQRLLSMGIGLDFIISIESNNKISFIAQNAANANIIIANPASTTTIASNVWAHLLMSWDLATATLKVYINDIDRTATPGTLTNSAIDYTQTRSGIGHWDGGSGPGSTKYNGDMAEFYFQDGEFLDLTVTNNRRKFIDADGNPVDLGSDGSTPTGTSPIIYLSGDTSTWHTNKGTGGGFTEFGALTDGSTPVNVGS